MRLNGISPGVGTIMYHPGSMRFMAVDTVDERGCTFRWAEANEVTPAAFRNNPRSIVEHRAIPRQPTAYGLARVYGHNGLKPTPQRRTR
jgi:hypothetical protein